MFVPYLLLPFMVGFAFANDCDLKQTKADIAFLLDSSSSVSNSEFAFMMNFVENVLSAFTISPNDVRVAAALFTSQTKPLFGFNNYSDEMGVQTAFRNITRAHGGTAIVRGLHWVLQQFTNISMDARKDVRHHGILITDGRSRNTTATEIEADLLRQANVEMVVIGISMSVRKDELSYIASSEDHVFLVDHFKDLAEFQDCTGNAFCEGHLKTNSSNGPWTIANCTTFVSTPQQGETTDAVSSTDTSTFSNQVSSETRLQSTYLKVTTAESTISSLQTRSATMANLITIARAKQSLPTTKKITTLKGKTIPKSSLFSDRITSPVRYSNSQTTSSDCPCNCLLWQITAISSLSFLSAGTLFGICCYCCHCKRPGNQHEDPCYVVEKKWKSQTVVERKLMIPSSHGVSCRRKTHPLPVSEGIVFRL